MMIKAIRKNSKGEDGTQLIHPSDEAVEMMRQFYNTEVVGSKLTSYAAAFSARFSEQCWRIAAALHVAEHPGNAGIKQLAPETIANAARIAQWFIAGLRKTVSVTEKEAAWQRVQHIRDILSRYPFNTQTVRILEKNHGIEEIEMIELARQFPGSIELFEHRPEGGGRPSKRARVPMPKKAEISQPPTVQTPNTDKTQTPEEHEQEREQEVSGVSGVLSIGDGEEPENHICPTCGEGWPSESYIEDGKCKACQY